MQMTIDLPIELINEAMSITHISEKKDLITIALKNLIQQEKIKDIKKYFGKVDLDIDLDTLRDR
jgi:Arc/MetJ family transcription regulator